MVDSFLCHVRHLPDDIPDAGNGECCWGAGRDRRSCTCWEVVFDLEQAEPVQKLVDWLAAGIEPSIRQRMCEDCAYRPGSPERQGDPGHKGDSAELERIARESRFWCHQGMRRPVLFRHPSGVEWPGHAAAYSPPIVDGVPYKADGTPGDLCAGWAARSRALNPVKEVVM